MSYKFTYTEKWSDVWFMNLKPNEKLLFIYLYENCDIAGFIELNYKKWSFDIGLNKTIIEGALKGLSRGLVTSDTNDCIYIKNYLKHQKNYPLIPEKNPAHRGIIRRFDLYKYKFKIDDINEFIEGASKGLYSSIGNSNGNGISNGNGKKGESEGKKKFNPPTLDEVKLYFTENGFSSQAAERAFRGYNVANWIDSKGKPVLNWKQKMNNVWFTDENKIKVNPNDPDEFLKQLKAIDARNGNQM
jgi:hypothetical protein